MDMDDPIIGMAAAAELAGSRPTAPEPSEAAIKRAATLCPMPTPADFAELAEACEHAKSLRHMDGQKLKMYVAILAAKLRHAWEFRVTVEPLLAGPPPAGDPLADVRQMLKRLLEQTEEDLQARVKGDPMYDYHMGAKVALLAALNYEPVRAALRGGSHQPEGADA